jgi:hypothetical protein
MMRSLTEVNGSNVNTLFNPVCTFWKDIRPERSKVDSSALSSAPTAALLGIPTPGSAVIVLSMVKGTVGFQ